jgi:peptide-methionine (R)-S-oxide reductase
MKITHTLLAVLGMLSLCTPGCAQNAKEPAKVYEVQKTPEEWRAQLAPAAYHVLREKGTERAFTGAYHNLKSPGTYHCAGCSLPLFSHRTKFDSGTGWPSFYDVISQKYVDLLPDHSHGWVRTEVVCARCGGHLGHVFDDGPKPTGLRYCINSVSLRFEPAR